MNNRQSPEPRPALETEDIKSQLNAIVAPYGILFPESMQEESISLDLSTSFSIDHDQSVVGGRSLGLRSDASFPSQESLKTVSKQPTMSDVNGTSLGIRSAQGSVVESTADMFPEGTRWSSLDGSPESREPAKGAKPGSKLVKGWKKFRQSLKAGSTQSNNPGAPPTLFGSHSSVAEDTRNVSPAVSSVVERKALSDLDPPFEIGSDDILDLGPGFGTGLTSKFSSGSLKALLHKGSSISSMREVDVDLLPPLRSRTMDSHDKHHKVERGAVVVDTESIMPLGKMRQYRKDGWTAQQRLIQHNRSSSEHHQGGSVLDHVNTSIAVSNTSQPTGPIPATSKDSDADSSNAGLKGNVVVTTGSNAGAGSNTSGDIVQNPKLESIALVTSVESEEPNMPVIAVTESAPQDDLPVDIVIVTEPDNEIGDGPVASGIDIEDEPKVVPRERNRLGEDLATSQRWRLSTHGSPKVVGSICEKRVSVALDNEVYLQRLMQDSAAPEQNAAESDIQPDENDRLDNTFKVPLHQSVQLASAMFDNGQRIPLVLYYVTEELRARVSRGDIVETIDSLFPVDWEETDEAFEELVSVFDERPFGQLFDLSLHPCDQPIEALSPNNVERQNQPLEQAGPVNTEGTESDACITSVNQVKPRVSSRDLSRLVLRFLKDFPEPLIPADVFSTFLAMTKLQTLDSIKIQASSLLVQLLSTEHRELLQFLLEFLDEVVLRSLRDELERLENLDPQSIEQERTLPELSDKYKETFDRLSIVLGVVFSHATKSDAVTKSLAGLAEKQPSQTSLYRHYKRDFELKALQEKNALAIRNSAAVFQSLLTFRTTIFGASSFCLSQEHKDNSGVDSTGEGSRGVDQDDHSSVDGSVCEIDSDYEYQSDSALYEVTSKRKLGRRTQGLRAPGSPKRLLTKAKTLHSRHHRHSRRDRRRQRKGDFSLVVTTAEDGADGEQGVQKKTSADTLCDSAVEMTTNVDVLALAAMQEHTARLLRSQKHLPRPSVASLHSVLAEAHSIVDANDTPHPLAAAVARGDKSIIDDAVSMVGDASRTEYGEVDRLDRRGKNGGEADDDEETYVRKLEFGHTTKSKREYGFMDFLQEPLDRQQEEREIQLVEKEILRSEITTKFLAANLAGLYPSSSQTAIPPVILPSARSTLLQPQSSSRSSTDLLVVPQTSQDMSEAPTTGASAFNRELTLEPKEQIQLPADHRTSDDCSCTYCTTLVLPSQIPVLTRDEYEKAELQSQCDAKDQHIAELLKTVQSLQGQVNILNAKLLFLHDHHTTRPMRRRTLARNSFPAAPSSNPATADWSSRQQHQHPPQQLSDVAPVRPPPSSAPQSGAGQSSLTSPPSSIMPASGNGQASLQPSTGSPKIFAEGVKMSNNTDTHSLSQGKSRHMSLGWDYGHGQDLNTLEEDEAMSILELDDQQHQHQRPLPPPFPTNNSAQRPGRSTGFGGPTDFFDNGLRDVEEVDEEPEREGEDLLDEFYYMDAYKTMDQQLYRRPILPMAAPPRPMSADQYKKHHRMSLPIQNLSKRLSLGQTFRWKGRATAA